jgi:hypothetical protein
VSVALSRALRIVIKRAILILPGGRFLQQAEFRAAGDGGWYLEDMTRWQQPEPRSTKDLTTLIPAEDTSILDEGRSPVTGLIANRRWLPFLERDGRYRGKPPDDTTAIHELERLRQSGARFMIFVWPALWSLEYNSGLNDYLRALFRCIRENARLVVFDLRR